jgi:hypothetical protein
VSKHPFQVVQGTNQNALKVSDRMPAGDEWYRPEPGYEQKKPGEILKWRKVPRGLSIDNKNKIRLKGAWQFQYRTTNSLGGPDATIVTVLVPRNAKKNNLFVYNWFSVSILLPIAELTSLTCIRMLLLQSKFLLFWNCSRETDDKLTQLQSIFSYAIGDEKR